MSAALPADRWLHWAHGPTSGRLLRALGLPTPPRLDRSQHGAWPGLPLQGVTVVASAAPQSWALQAARTHLTQLGATVSGEATAAPAQALLFDATGCNTPAALRALFDGLAPPLRQLAPNARLLVLAADPLALRDPAAAACAQGVQGFVRALAKETGRLGATANLLLVAPDALERLTAPLAFFCSARSCFVSGQVLRVDAHTTAAPPALPHPPVLKGKLALVTGAAQGLGAALAHRLAQDGAHVLCADLPQSLPALQAVAHACGGAALVLDVGAADAAQRLLDAIRAHGLAAASAEPAGGIDIVVHNAGITRDKTLARMGAAQWDAVLDVNLAAIVRLDAALDQSGLLRPQSRNVYLSSVSGVAGNRGQTNYATSKAALIGYVAARARLLAASGGTANALAPGFIETAMTQRIPFVVRQAGRRLNSLGQGGLPIDVAEAAAFLTRPDAHGISGQTLRVCGQALMGA